MGNTTTKEAAQLSQENVLRNSYNEADKSLTTGTFVTTKLGHKVTRTVVSPTVDDFEYYDGSVLLYTIRVTYNNSAHDEVDQVERTV